MVDLPGKQNAVAKLINGEVIDDTDRVAVCIKGVVNGFPAQFDAFMTGWPFSVTYIVESRVVESGSDQRDAEDCAKISIVPRFGQGFWSIFSKIFLFESKGMSVGDRRLEKKMIFSYDLREPALRLIKYPGIPEILQVLEEDCKMKEMMMKTNAGIIFTQSANFEELDLDMCQATFNYLSQIAKVMSEIFE